jgi:site-specific recombinase XerD
MKKCIKCAKTIDDNFVFCPYCGKKQETKTKKTRRGNGTGSVYKDERGHYTAEITVGYRLNDGKMQRKIKRKKGFTTKKSALEWITDFKNGNTKAETITISQLWETFKNNNINLSDSKITAYRIAYNKIKSEIDFRTIDSFNVSELQDITDEFGNSYYTKRDIKNLLSHFYKIALMDEYVNNNKAQYIRLPKCQSNERSVFTDADISKVWADYNNRPEKITAAVLILLYTGIRPGELLTIQSANVNLADHYMTGGIKSEKGKRRKIIIPDKIAGVVEFLLSFGNDNLCEYPYKNLFYDEYQIKREQLGLSERLTPYCCRHTFITRLTSLNASPAMLQELVGHDDYETTLNYTHLSILDRLNLVNKL